MDAGFEDAGFKVWGEGVMGWGRVAEVCGHDGSRSVGFSWVVSLEVDVVVGFVVRLRCRWKVNADARNS